MVHKLKTHAEAFEAVWQGKKTAEFRRDDRTGGYQCGDILILVEIDAGTEHQLGRWMGCVVTDVRRGSTYGIPEGYVMLSIRVEMRADKGFKGKPFVSDFTA